MNPEPDRIIREGLPRVNMGLDAHYTKPRIYTITGKPLTDARIEHYQREGRYRNRAKPQAVKALMRVNPPA